ncbi:hypothetical protein H2201_002291 [Coniosporium apollinis]|uniref:Cytochrome P450 oxidoreductase n=1 Tax=Coniosporium apollinis TaxID=61459 RepID=A0ABQ9NZK9_9PEZI|nr:hypothetical protein H2201_002291 [Coniosporium apollinis]
MMVAGYSGRDLPYLEECVDNRLGDFFKLIEEKYTSAGSTLRPVDFAQKAQYFGIDVITDIACGEPFGFLSQDADVHGYISTQLELIPIFEWFSTLPILDKIMRVPFISRMAMPTSEDKTGVGRLMGVAKRTVSKRFGPEKITKKDMIGSWLQHGLSQEQVEVESVLQVIAGADSTVTALRAITMFIITNPTVYSTLQAELDQASISESIIRESETKALPYLQACIKEGLRIHPPVTALATKTVAKSGDILRGQFIPGGTNIVYAAWDSYKDAEVFGEDADIFRPERWLEATGDRLSRMQQTLDLVFGYGRYGCLGKPVALLEINKFLAEV